MFLSFKKTPRPLPSSRLWLVVLAVSLVRANPLNDMSHASQVQTRLNDDSEAFVYTRVPEDGFLDNNASVNTRNWSKFVNNDAENKNRDKVDLGITSAETSGKVYSSSSKTLFRKRGFSIFDMFEGTVSMFSTGIGSIINNFVGPESKSYNKVSYKNYQLLRLYPYTQRQVKYLRDLRNSEQEELKFWTLPAVNKTSDVVVSPDLLGEVKSFLKDKNIYYTILMTDLQQKIALQNPKIPKEKRDDLVTNQGHPLTWKRYHRYADISRYLEYLEKRYPELVELITIGNSFEGKPLTVVKVSTGLNKNGEAKPIVWVDAGMHAREWIAPAVATFILSQLVEKNSSYAALLNSSDWMILPMANPDGYEYSHVSDRLWRKTRSTHEDADDDYTPDGFFQIITYYTKWLFGRCQGVDLNRNFGYHWGEDKSETGSSDPCHETYAGPRAFSEPETLAISNFIMEHHDKIKMYLTLHSYSQMWLMPWGYTLTKPSDYTDMEEAAKKAVGAIIKLYGTQYQVGLASDLLYTTAGASDDWAKGTAGIKYSYTVELRDLGKNGFLLPASQIIPTAKETWAGIRAIVRSIFTPPAH